MRIITGKYKSRKIFSSAIYNKSLRPTTDRARETLFNVLENYIDFEGKIVIDLFAGTGALGFEALSRDASLCDFVDVSNKSLELIRKTSQELNCEDRIRLYKKDSIVFLNNLNEFKYDIVFADPPYNFNKYERLIREVAKNEPKVFVLEASSKSDIGYANCPFGKKPGLRTIQRNVGNSSFKIF